MKKSKKPGFTLIEILVVIAVIALLAAILVPVVGAAMRKVKETTTKSKFTSWITAIEQYKQTYQYYPILETGRSVGDDEHYDLGDGNMSLNFVKALSARDPSTGDKISRSDQKNFNTKAKEFFAFSVEDFTQEDGSVDYGTLADGFGNRHIHVVMDTDGNKRVVIPSAYTPDDATDAETDSSGLMKTVIIFTSKNDGDDYENVYSWR
ncbi:MAG: type II secretion system GspH family protein [Opitutae bacterium]|nr:type II secretion system GspH family protein [Opitutae bacterium]